MASTKELLSRVTPTKPDPASGAAGYARLDEELGHGTAGSDTPPPLPAPPASPPPEMGTLHVHLVSATGLKSADRNGKSDPYARLRLAGQQLRSKTLMETLEPRWDANPNPNPHPHPDPEVPQTQHQPQTQPYPLPAALTPSRWDVTSLTLPLSRWGATSLTLTLSRWDEHFEFEGARDELLGQALHVHVFDWDRPGVGLGPGLGLGLGLGFRFP